MRPLLLVQTDPSLKKTLSLEHFDCTVLQNISSLLNALPQAKPGCIVLKILTLEDLTYFPELKEKSSSPIIILTNNAHYADVVGAATNFGFGTILPGDLISPLQIIKVIKSMSADFHRCLDATAERNLISSLCDRLPHQMAYRIEAPPRGNAKFVYLSQGIEKISGLKKEQVFHNSSLLYDQIIEEDRTRADEAEKIAVKTHSILDIVVRKRNAQGEIKWVNICSIPHEEPDRTIVWDGIESDITAWKESQERLQLATEAAQLGTWDYHPLTGELIWDFRCKELFFFDPAHPVTYEIFLGGIHLNDRDRIDQAVQDALDPEKRQHYDVEFRVSHAQNLDIRWVRSTGRVYFENDVATRFIGTAQDITERKLQEESLGILTAAVESANDAVVITEGSLDDPGPKIQYINSAFTLMTGYEAKDILGKTPRILQGELTDKKLLKRLRTDLKTKQSFFGETVNYRKDGSAYDVEWRITPVKDPSGKVRYWAAIQRDITERKAEEKKKELLLASERAARTAAEHASRMKDEFLATLSHELRTPINAVLGWAQLLKRGNRREEDVKQSIGIIERNARLQVQLIDDLLDMNRIISGKIHMEMQPVELQSVVMNAIETIEPVAQAKGISLEKSLNASGIIIYGDAARLHQIIWNLLSNAVKFTPKNGSVKISLTKAGEQAIITVTDSGIGIAPEFLPYVFDRFRQADASTTRKYGGLGLGLSIVRHLMELHHGEVSVESKGPGTGSTFSLSFPLVVDYGPSKDHNGSGADIAAYAHFDLSGVSFLVVDDEPDALGLVQRILEESHATVITAHSVEQALNHLSSVSVNMLISDIGMPAKDGFELIAEIRKKHAPEELPAIALTAYARTEDRKKILMTGFQSHLFKPVNAHELLKIACELVGRKAA